MVYFHNWRCNEPLKFFVSRRKIKILVKLRRGLKSSQKLGEIYIRVDFCVIEKKVSLHLWFIFKIDGAMSF